MPLHAGPVRTTSDARLDDLVAAVVETKPYPIDGWEATSILESLGYTDVRVQREFGLNDARAAGEYVSARARAQPFVPTARWAPPRLESPLAIVVRSAASTLIYAVPWLIAFLAQTIRPDAMRMPSRIAPPLALALMFSLVASGGMVQAIARRGEFYVGLRQIEMARHVVRALLRIGVTMIVALATLSMFVGWYFGLFGWSSLVLGGDAFVIMSVLWMVCGTFAIRQQQWRVAVAFVVGVAVFAIVRSTDADAVTAQLGAVCAVLAIAALQMPAVFGERRTVGSLPPGVRMPRLSVLVYWTLPYFWYGTVYFAFLFADRLSAGTASAAWGGPFGIPAQYSLGMELALLTLLIAASGAEVSGALFARAFACEAVHPLTGGAWSLSARLRRHHTRALVATAATFLVTAVIIATIAHRTMPDALTPAVRLTLLAGDLGYACLAISLTNVLILFGTQRPWVVVREFTAALAINLIAGYVLSHGFDRFHAVDGLLLSAAYFAFRSTRAVREALRHADYSYAVGQ